jgi:hypothetical protein
MDARQRKGAVPRARRTAVLERPAAAPDLPDSALWSIAMLRVAVELKRPGAPGLEQIVEGVVARMGIPRADFEKYLAEHLGLLKKAVEDRGYTR